MKAWLLFIALTDLHIERLNKAEEPIQTSQFLEVLLHSGCCYDSAKYRCTTSTFGYLDS